MTKTLRLFSVIAAAAVMAVPSFAAEPDNMLILINSSHRIEKDYDPERVRYKDSFYYLNEEAADALDEMLSAMEEDIGEAPMVISTYRSYERQEEIYNNDIENAIRSGIDPDEALEHTRSYIAYPGSSEHQSALAVDLSNDGSLEEDFIYTEAGIWIKEHCHEYGFIVRYPDDKEMYTGINYEPWHIRYVGHPYSDIIYENDWCLEEFIAYMKRNTYMDWERDGDRWSLRFSKTLDDDGQNVQVSFTNSGGYIITTKKNRITNISVAKGADNNIMKERLMMRLEMPEDENRD